MTASALLIAGCSQDGTPAAAQTNGLCPSCTALGGETGDFSGGDAPIESCPQYDLVPANGDLVLDSGLRAAAAEQFVERDLALPGVWRNLDDSYDGQHEVGGFTEQTGLHAHIEVTGVSRLERSANQFPWGTDDAATEAACNGLVLSVRVTLESDDGAVVGSFENGRADVYSETEAQVRAVADVKQFRGSLELTGAPGEQLIEQLEIYLGPRGARGSLTTAVAYGLASDAPVGTGDPFLELRAGADDSCAIYAFPYDGAEATSSTEDIMSALAASSPYTGFYDHRDVGGPAVRPPSTPEETQVSVDLGAPTSVCQGRGPSDFGQRWSRRSISFDAPAHWHTADARYDFSAVLHGGSERGADGNLLRANAGFTSDVLTTSQLRDRYGIDVASSGAECAQLELNHSTLGDSRLSVWGGPCNPDPACTPTSTCQNRWVQVLTLAQ